MERLRTISELRIRTNSPLPRLVWLAAGALLISAAHAQGPLAAKINVTPLASYTGSNPLPKPEKILVYDFAINPDDVQVDKIQSLRPRHLITGDQKPDSIAAGASKAYSQGTDKGAGEDRHSRGTCSGRRRHPLTTRW